MNTKVSIAGVELKNPITVASGTFGSGMEYDEFVDLNLLGAVTTKGVANVPWPGNPTPRVAETYGGGYDECNRIAESGNRYICEAGYPILKGEGYEDYCQCVWQEYRRLSGRCGTAW